MKIKNCFFRCLCMFAFVASLSTFSIHSFAGEIDKENLRTGYEDMEELEVPFDYADGIMAYEDLALPTYQEAEGNYWKTYSSKYYYNKLSAAQKKFWDHMEAWCLHYITSYDDLESFYTDKGGYYYGYIPAYNGAANGLSTEDAKQVIMLFGYANPQYYFLRTSYFIDPSFMSICLYDDFLNGETRREYTQKFRAQLEAWHHEADAKTQKYSGDERTLRIELECVDIICDETTYELDCQWNQSAASLVFNKKTVCAGYTKTLSLLLNGFGIENTFVAASSGSAGHVWNEVNIGGHWYVTDATWADTKRDGTTYRGYVNTSYDFFGLGEEFHIPSAFKPWYKDLWPACNEIYNGDYETYRIAAPYFGYQIIGDNIKLTVNNRYASSNVLTKEYSGPVEAFLEPDTSYSGALTIPGNKFINAQAVVSSWATDLEDSRIVTFGPYNITFNGNGGTGTVPESERHYINEFVTLPAGGTLSRPNFRFLGWNTQADGKGFRFKTGKAYDSITYVPGAKVNLYAEWEQLNYNIKYELFGGTNNKENPGTYNIDNGISSFKAPTKAGCKFAGWYMDAAYTEAVSGIPAKTTGNVTLYAKWITLYNIKFNGNGATSGKTSGLTNLSYGETYYLSINGFEKKGCTFDSWNTRADGKGTRYTKRALIKSLTDVPGGTVTLYAQWRASEKYSINYELDGGKNNSLNPKSYTAVTKTITLAAPTKKGYEFKGWFSDSAFRKPVTEIKEGSTGNKKLYAKWTLAKYKVTYKLDGGKNNKKNVKTYSMKSADITLLTPTKKGYTFKGWYSDAKFRTGKNVITSGSTGNKTFYAKWAPYQYSVKFDGNGAKSGKMSLLKNKKYGISFKLPRNKFVRKGYVFAGWNTKKNGKGTAIKDMDSVKNLTDKSGATVTLYAQWKKKK